MELMVTEMNQDYGDDDDNLVITMNHQMTRRQLREAGRWGAELRPACVQQLRTCTSAHIIIIIIHLVKIIMIPVSNTCTYHHHNMDHYHLLHCNHQHGLHIHCMS